MCIVRIGIMDPVEFSSGFFYSVDKKKKFFLENVLPVFRTVDLRKSLMAGFLSEYKGLAVSLKYVRGDMQQTVG